MKRILLAAVMMTAAILSNAQAVIPNPGFENWTSFGNYSDPDGWDTPNEELMAIPFFGTTVVTRSTEKHSGIYSARLESKHITLPPLDIPGFIITADLELDITSMEFTITGGVPLNDQPQHLTGFYKYLPKGGDSCIIGIGLFKTIAGIQDTIAHGEFTTKDTVTDWTPFSAWIDYDTLLTPDTMQVYAFSTAQETLTPGTVLFIDDVAVDYITSTATPDPAQGIRSYYDRETGRILLFFDFPTPRSVAVSLYDMTGNRIFTLDQEVIGSGRRIVPVQQVGEGIFLLHVVHDGQRLTRKYFIGR